MRLAKLVLAGALTLLGSTAQAELRVGAKAPGFALDAALAGQAFRFSLADALAKGPVVLYFYPKSFTSVCTEEAHLFAEAMEEFAANGASVVGVSADTIETQRKFSSLECRDKFPVAADPDMAVIKAYDAVFRLAFVDFSLAARISYVIAPDGTILSSLQQSGAAGHIQKSLEAVKVWRAGAAR